MAAADFLDDLYAKIWALLEAHDPFTALVKVNNRMKLDKVQPVKTNRQDADLIEAELWPAELSDAMYTATANFGYTTSFNPSAQNWKEPMTAVYRLDLITPNLKIALTHRVILEALTALRKGGPRWGLDYVRGWGPVTMNERPDGLAEPVSGTMRIVSRLRIPVEMNWNGSSLIT